MGLSLLPTEIQCAVVRYLDPITLISISQTSTHFRSLVRPSERHFAERLLALEVLPEHGGMSPWFDSSECSENSLDPSCDSPAWETIRLACPRCRRLRHHRYFDNQAVLRLAYRKPPAAASVHELPPTSWEPSMSLVYPAPAELERARLREKRLRRRYFLCVTRGHGNMIQDLWPEATDLRLLLDCGMTGFEDITPHEFNDLKDKEKFKILAHNARAIERERAGYRRLQRRCIECRYQLGRIPMLQAGNHGSTEMPILASRQASYGTYFDRWFPGLSDNLVNKRPPFNAILHRYYRRGLRSRRMTTFVARCARCARWQEIRHFRIGGEFTHWRPLTWGQTTGSRMWDGRRMGWEMLRGQHCNACFADEFGREALGAVLVRWAHHLVELEMPIAIRALLDCFGRWRPSIYLLPEEYHQEAGAILKEAPCLHENRSSHHITLSDVEMLRRRWEKWRDMARRLREEEKLCGGVGGADPAQHDAESDTREADEWYARTESEFTKSEAMCRWFTAVRAEVEERPEALVEWALSSPRFR